MPVIKSVRGFTTKWGSNVFLAVTAIVVGDVVMGNDCSVWFKAVVPSGCLVAAGAIVLEESVKYVTFFNNYVISD